MQGKGTRRGEAGWRELLGRFAGSGLRVDEFCRREGIASASFYRWRKLLGMSVGSGEAEQAQSLPLPRSQPGFVDLGAVGVSGSRVELHFELGELIRVQLVRA